MADPWPASLPQRMLVAGFVERPPETRQRSEPDVGPSILFNRSTVGRHEIDGGVALDATQKATLEAFHATTLGNGTLPFDWVHPISQAATTFRFRSVPSYTPRARGQRWTGRLELEILP